jgi:undecaprenyl-phosphate 4-deoxy-4-formamido-L-arabinose transferase
MNRPDLSIVIPVYNEQETLPELLKRTLEACRPLNRPFELILIDDGSSDDSARLISQAAAEEPEVVAVLLNRNYGQHAAVFAGLQQSCGEVVVTLDADLQNPPEETCSARQMPAPTSSVRCGPIGRTAGSEEKPRHWST